MKLTIRDWRAIERADIDLSSLAIVSGRNAAGKTSIIQAAQAALLRQVMITPGVLKKDSAVLVRRGADHASVTLTCPDGWVSIEYPQGSLATGGDAPPPAGSAIAAGTVSILDMKDADRAGSLAKYLPASATDKDDLGDAMREAGFAGDSIQNIRDRIAETGWDAVHKAAAEHGAKIKGQWEQITSEKWGDKKAALWMPHGFTEDLAFANHADLQTRAANAESDVVSATRSGAVGEAEVARLKEAVHAAEHVDVEARRQVVDEARAALKALQEHRATLPVADEADTCACPHCGNAVAVDVPYKGKPVLKIAGAPVEPAELKKRRLAIAELDGTIQHAQTELRTAENALEHAVRIFSDGERAAARIEQIAAAPEASSSIDAARGRRDAAVADLRRYEAWAEARKRYEAWARNAALVDLLAPDGLRKRALLRRLDRLNKALSAASEAAGWPTVRLDENLNAHVGVEPYGLVSESMQWRARVTIQCVLAAIEEAPLIIIDRADVLDARGRNGLFNLLAFVNRPTLIGMTANKPALVPDLAAAGLGRSYFVDGGIASEITAHLQEKAA